MKVSPSAIGVIESCTSVTKVDAWDIGSIRSIHGCGLAGPGCTRLDHSTNGRSVIAVWPGTACSPVCSADVVGRSSGGVESDPLEQVQPRAGTGGDRECLHLVEAPVAHQRTEVGQHGVQVGIDRS